MKAIGLLAKFAMAQERLKKAVDALTVKETVGLASKWVKHIPNEMSPKLPNPVAVYPACPSQP
jgi:hypothetical protein